MEWLFFALTAFCVAACTICGICHWSTCLCVIACISIGAFCEYRQIRKHKLFRAMGVLLFFLLLGLSFVNGGGLRAIVVDIFLNVIWALLGYRALSHKKTSEKVQVGVLTIIPLICISFSLQATGFLCFLSVYLMIWFIYLMHLSVVSPTTGCVAASARSGDLYTQNKMRIVGSAIGVGILVLIGGCILFLLIPRWGSNTVTAVPGVEQPRGAFPDVALDKTGTIELDPSLVFRADVPKTSKEYYWRIDVQNIFDGTRWRTYGGNAKALMTQNPERTDAFNVEFVREWRDYRLPTLVNTTWVELDDEDKTANNTIRFYPDSMGLWRRWGWQRGSSLMTFRFWLDNRSENDRMIADDVIDIIKIYFGINIDEEMQLIYHRPELIWPGRRRGQYSEVRKRLYNMAVQMAGNAKTPREKANHVRDYLKTHYQYSLERPERKGSIVEDFLFEQKFGHCEVFSTTMAVLLAQLGIPVRNVSGFVSSEFRNGYNYVRSAHAHSWVEVYLDGKWEVYDPTPSGSQQVKVDWLLQLNDWFASYRPQNIYRWFGNYGWIVLSALGGLLLLIFAARYPVRYLYARIRPTAEVWNACWTDLMKSCSEHDQTKHLSLQPLETWWSEEMHTHPSLRAFARQYIAARYGRHSENADTAILSRIKHNHRIIRKCQLLQKKIGTLK